MPDPDIIHGLIGGRPAWTPSSNPNLSIGVTFEKERDEAVRALNAADIAVYPVDARGLTTNPKALISISTMKDLAGGRGGKAYCNRNDLMNSIREAVQDTQVSYTLPTTRANRSSTAVSGSSE